MLPIFLDDHVGRRSALFLSTVLLAACGSSGSGPTPAASLQRLSTHVALTADGAYARSFSGVAAPQNLEFVDEDGVRRHVFDLFPRDNCPFAIDTNRQLGDGGYGLTTVDRTLAAVVPTADDAPWALNMVPFGVTIEGSIIDPSGPWFDGGAADPANPFDRACTGWEYDPIFPAVAALVGVSSKVRGHVQPGPGGKPGSAGLFHYHGAPQVMLDFQRSERTGEEKARPFVIGYSADGFWILDSVIPASATTTARRRHLFSGYVLREGTRSVVPHTNPALVPSGTYDGTYDQDWTFDPERKRALIEAALRDSGEYLGLTRADVDAGTAELALLDERNGFVTDQVVLPDAPSPTYVYVLTPDWPEVPRAFAFEPSESFRQIIPFEGASGATAPGRRQLYDHCAADLADVHQWGGRDPY